MASQALSGAASGAAAGAAFGPWGAVIGGGVGLLSSFFNKQKSPKGVSLPPYEKVDLDSETRRALKTNLQSQSSIEALLEKANTFNQEQALSLTEQAMPGFGNLSKKFLQTADDMISDPYALPDDVPKNLGRIAAERGISNGGRGQFSQFSLLRDLGVNMLDYGGRRIGQAQSLLSMIGSLSPRVSPLSPLSFYVTPQQAASVAATNSAGAAGIASGNQGVQQGVENAGVAAANWNRNNMWQSASDFAAVVPSLIPKKADPGEAT